MIRFCLIPLRNLIRGCSENYVRLLRCLEEIVSKHQPDVICLSECTLTGYLYEVADFEQFTEPVPGPTINRISELARKHGTYFCFGLLEKSEAGIYNTAVMFDRTGSLILKHQKNNEMPPFITGKTVVSINIEFGKVSILIYGDLFSGEVREKLARDLDFLIIPMVCSFDGQSPDKKRWEEEGRSEYLGAAKAAKSTTLLVNALETICKEPSFGGALIVGASGELLAESPHGTDDVLIWDAKINGD